MEMDGLLPSAAAPACDSAQCCTYCQREFFSLRTTIDGLEVENAQRGDEIAQLSQRVHEQSTALESLWELVWELQRGHTSKDDIRKTDPSRQSAVEEEGKSPV